MISFIDQYKCTGCGICFKSCSLDVFRIDTDQPECAPCMAACPAGTDIRGCNSLIQQGRFEEAAEKFIRVNPFPAITGRVCFHPCEKECSRNHVDGAVNINALEQFLGDLEREALPAPAILHTSRVAIVGSGPAGLSCAWFMARMGYPVTVFEALSKPGGMLRHGIPAYRLPDIMVDDEVDRLRLAGVQFVCNTRIGKGGDLTVADLRRRGFKTVLLAPGANLSRRIDIPGIDLEGVLWGVEFLRAVRQENPPCLSGDVVVIGGGDVAVDAAISARKLGAAKVTMVSLEAEDALLAYPHNQENARYEGIIFECGWGPVRVNGQGAANSLTVRRCLSVTNAEGHFDPRFHDKENRQIPATTIIFAIGQSSDPKPFADDVDIDPLNIIKIVPDTFASSNPFIFAAGDAATGPASVVRAIAGGREAAVSMDRFLRGGHINTNRGQERPLVKNPPREGMLPVPRNERRVMSGFSGFVETRQGFDTEKALGESMRCMTCGARAHIAYTDDCMTCFTCELRCPAEAITVHPFKEILPRTLEMNCEE